MKQSKNMYFERTLESYELQLYIENVRVLCDHYNNICVMLDKKLQRGVFDHRLAWKAFYKVCNHGTELYYKSFGYRFNTQQRYTVAVILATDYMVDRGLFS